jgi:uncharacterized protein (DUF2141 family)
MIRFSLFYFLILPLGVFAQVEASRSALFHPRDPKDTFSIFMENKDIPVHDADKPTYSITITVTHIRNTKGVIRFKFYDETTPFPDKKGFLRIVVPKTKVVDGTFTATYEGFTEKMMGIALLDDENDNWELDMGWFLPKEGHAFSNYYHTALRKPVFSDFKFLLSSNKEVTMKMKYY